MDRPGKDPLSQPIGRGRGRASGGFNEMGITTVADLLRHYPRRYERWGELTPIASLPVGGPVSVLVRVLGRDCFRMRNKAGYLIKLRVTDGMDDLEVTFFNVRESFGQRFPVGREVLLAGTVESFRGRLQLTHPKVIDVGSVEKTKAAMDKLDSLIPVYPATKALSSDRIAKAVESALATLGDVDDPIPAEVRARHSLMHLREAFDRIHRPRDERDWKSARYRMQFEEAFVLQAALARRRWTNRALLAIPRHAVPGGLLDTFDARLPFDLTAGQAAVGEEIAAGLAAVHPMHRLLQGEVGSGKTVVAVRAMLTVVDAGGQAALLAPTEVLAAQHHRSITALLGDLARQGELGGDERGTRVALLTGSMSTAARRSALLDLVTGDAGIVVGTHALLSEHVEFFDLGLVVVDEQHRFGVEQRDALRTKGRASPHVLVMTATPIPRTVAMTVFGDLETSTLRELPAGRAPITTHVVPVEEKPSWLERTWTRLRDEVDAGRQCYVVCPRIGMGDSEEAVPVAKADQDAIEASPAPNVPTQDVLTMHALLRSHEALAGLRIEMLHGRMPADARDAVMRAFAAGDVDILVATTVIEVGVDVPRASAMVVMDADRFGVSQLHQLRGRVGRGSAPGICLLLTRAAADSPARRRLDAVAATLDGFELAKVDLEERREGDVLGAAQSGAHSSLRLLRVVRDERLIETARHEASAVIAADPDLRGNTALARAMGQILDAEREAFLDRG